MYNFISVGGTTLNRLGLLDNSLYNIIDATSVDHFKEHVDKRYIVIIQGLNNNPNEEFSEYIEYINQNNIPVVVDALYEANVMKFHYSNITSPTTLLTSNMLVTNHTNFDNVITIPYFLLQSYCLLTQQYKIPPITYNEHISKTKASFLCLNGVNKPSRRAVYDYLRDNNLINDAIFSFINRNAGDNAIVNYPTITLDNDIVDIEDGVTWDNTYRSDWFYDTYFNLVTESSANNDANTGNMPLMVFDNTFFPTEKTFKPIYNTHPFICVADFDYHKNLNELLGFELYDEVFDYSFDSIKTHDRRWRCLLENLPTEIDYTLIKEKLEFNQHRFLDKQRNTNILINMLKQIDNLHN